MSRSIGGAAQPIGRIAHRHLEVNDAYEAHTWAGSCHDGATDNSNWVLTSHSSVSSPRSSATRTTVVLIARMPPPLLPIATSRRHYRGAAANPSAATPLAHAAP